MNEISEQMNSDMFNKVERANYDVTDFTSTGLKQAKESFEYNGYSWFESDGVLSVKRS